jgi:prophage antirepressor-like protein
MGGDNNGTLARLSETQGTMTFMFDDKEITLVTGEDGKLWVVAKTVSEPLAYTNPSDAASDHCKYQKLLNGVNSTPLTDSPYGITIIPESDVFRLIMRSNMLNAERFQDWACEEALPSIRHTRGT